MTVGGNAAKSVNTRQLFGQVGRSFSANELVSQCLAGPMNATANRAHFDIHQLRDRSIVKSLHLAKHENRSLIIA
jgi:hypothetical protein